MVIEDSRHHSSLRSAFLSAGRWLGFDVNDQNGYSQTGFAPYMFTIKGGQRWSTGKQKR